MNCVVVVHRSQNIINLASIVRLMKNYGLRDLRLVEPAEFDVRRIEGVAHQSGDVLQRMQEFPTLDAALADCTHVVALTARGRTAKRNYQRPRDAAPEILAESAHGLAALVLGPEDKGLSNDDLDRCHRAVVIPTHPDYPSLNVAQAFNVMAYELFVAADAAAPLKPAKREAAPASRDQVERLFVDIEAALHRVDFFKAREPELILRSIRTMVHRTPLDGRETTLLRAMALEVVRYLDRVETRA